MGSQPSTPSHTSPDARPVVTGACHRCGRAISGFPGDYARCKPCRVMTQLPADPPRGWRTVREPDKLAVMPFYLIFLFYASIVAVAWTGGGTGLIGGATVVFVFAMWIYSIMQFSKTAEKQPGWWIPVVLYHVASLAIPLCLWLGVRGCSPIMQGDFAPTNLLQSVLAAAGLFLCILIYGAARGRLARLRIVRTG